MIHFVLCDDIALHNHTLCSHLQNILPTLPVNTEISLITTNPHEVIRYARSANEQTIYMLDLVLEQDITGLDVCHAILDADPSAYILYISAYAEYAMDCCQSHAFDFIIKPYTYHRLEMAIHDVIRHSLRTKPIAPLHVRAGSVTRILDQKEIRYIQCNREYVTAYSIGDCITWRESMTHLLSRLNPDWFMRIHKSYIINRLYFQSVDTYMHEVSLQGGIVLPISRSSCQLFRQNKVNLSSVARNAPSTSKDSRKNSI